MPTETRSRARRVPPEVPLTLLDQKQLADALGMSYKMIANIEKETPLPRIEISRGMIRYELHQVLAALRAEYGVHYHPQPQTGRSR